MAHFRPNIFKFRTQLINYTIKLVAKEKNRYMMYLQTAQKETD